MSTFIMTWTILQSFLIVLMMTIFLFMLIAVRINIHLNMINVLRMHIMLNLCLTLRIILFKITLSVTNRRPAIFVGASIYRRGFRFQLRLFLSEGLGVWLRSSARVRPRVRVMPILRSSWIRLL